MRAAKRAPGSDSGAGTRVARASEHAANGASAADGFTIVVLLIAVAVTSILLTAAATTWTHVMRRENERELIWRGEQYVDAIECYIRARGVPPTDLEQLLDAQCIRKLYSQPLAADGRWELLRQQAPGLPPAASGAPGAADEPRGMFDRETRSSAPIVGVAPGIAGTAIVAYQDSREYERWEFTFAENERPAVRALGLPEGFEQGDPFDTILERIQRERERSSRQ